MRITEFASLRGSRLRFSISSKEIDNRHVHRLLDKRDSRCSPDSGIDSTLKIREFSMLLEMESYQDQTLMIERSA